MEILILILLSTFMLMLGALGKMQQFLALAGGIGLILLGITIMTGGIQVVSGYTTTTVGLTDTLTTNYTNIEVVFNGLNLLNVAMSLIYGAAGILIFLYGVGDV